MVFLFHFGYSQNVNTSLASDINQKFSLLEKNRIPNHILLDYGFDLIDVTQFDGALRSDNYLDLERYNLIYNSIVSSATQINVSGIKSPQQELEKWKTLQKQQSKKGNLNNKASVTLSGLLFNYSKINENALYGNKISVVNDKYDDKYINGVWQNPYDNKTAFAVVSPVFAFNKSNIEVKLPTELWHSNANITAIAIDFGDGAGYKNLTNNAIASTNYTATGVYTWTFRVKLTNGQYKYCRQKIKVTQIDSNPNLQARNSSCSIQYKSITATKDYQGVFGSATLQIAYGSNNCTMQKPLIVVEGLDTGIMGQGGSVGDTDIFGFFQSIEDSDSQLFQDLTIRDTDIDYDIVYVNWDNGTDYIQRNAYVLEEVIKWVNERKAVAGSTEPNVVLGQSMGGLVARYALKDMENDTDLNHDTSLYISHDAPHQGAHIPLGILHMGRHIVNEFIQTPLGNINIPINGTGSYGLSTIDDILDAPAVNQMLINNVDTNGNRTNSVHTAWQNELRLMGYPQQTRNIALSNASHCASDQGLVSNEELVTVAGEGGTSVLTSILELLFINIDPAVGIALNDVSAALLGFLPGNSSLDIEFRANAFPTSGTARIYKGRLTYEKRFLWLFPITRTIFNTSKHSQNGDKFIDNYPGGITPNGLAIAESGDDSNWFYNYDYNINVNLNFDFIPATSALDVGSGNAVLDNSDYFKQYTSANPPTGDKAIPFVNFSTSSNQNNSLNASHISFNKRNGDWLAEELDADANIDLFDCTLFCANTEIFGEDILCTSGIYSVTDQATTVNWTVIDPDNLVSYTTNGNEILLNQLNPNNYGTVTLNVIYGSPKCGYTTATKDIEVGILPSRLDNASINGVNSICDSQYYTYSISGFSHPCATSVNWTVSPNLNIVSQTATSVTVTRNPFNDQYAGIITADLPNSSFTIDKGVWVGVPSNDGLFIQKIGTYDLTVGRWTKLYAQYNPMVYPSNGPLNVTFEWQIPNSAIRNYDDTAYKDVKPLSSGQINIGVRAVCDCGNGEWKYRLFDVSGSGGGNELIPID